MKHFMIEITYTVSLEVISAIVDEHRAYLQTGYDKGWLLCSGPQNPKIGGVIIARAPTLKDIQAFFAHDPYHLKNAATHRIVEFDPVKRQEFLEGWVEGTK